MAQEVILVHAINIRGAGSLYTQMLKLADPILEEQKKILEEMGFSVEIEVLLGTPHYEINRLAREKNVSLIAVHMTAESLKKERIEKCLKDRLAEFNEIDQTRLERLKARLINIGAREVNIEIPYGSTTREILREVNNNPYSLVVMGSQGRGFISEVFLGSVSHNIVRKAPVPVLLVPAIR